MKTERQTRFLAVIAILLAVGGLSIGFAALSQQLTLGGAGQVEGSNWDIHFENLQPVVTVGQASIEGTAPTLSTTHFGDFLISLTAPGDTASYTFDIANDGTFNAEINDILYDGPTCTGTNPDAGIASTDATNVCNNITYSLTYVGGANDGAAVAIGDTLNAGATETVKLELSYSSSVTADLLPSALVNISNLDMTLSYVQVN